MCRLSFYQRLFEHRVATGTVRQAHETRVVLVALQLEPFSAREAWLQDAAPQH